MKLPVHIASIYSLGLPAEAGAWWEILDADDAEVCRVQALADGERPEALKARAQAVADALNKGATKLSEQMIADLMVTCFEGGSNYWIGSVKLITPSKDKLNQPWYADDAVYAGPFTVQITPDDEDEPKILDQDAITRGEALLMKLYPKRWASIAEEDYDAEDADVFLQLCLFGEVVYG